MNEQSLGPNDQRTNERLGTRLTNHLQREAALLDGLITAAICIRDFLRQSTSSEAASPKSDNNFDGPLEQSVANAPATPNLDHFRRSFIDLQSQLNQTYIRLQAARAALQNELSQLPITRDAPLSIREFSGKLDQQLGECLLTTWKLVKEKRGRFETIQAGNQVVLFYSIDHNRKLLSVFRSSKMNDGYDAMGNNRSDSENTAGILRTHC